MPVDTFPPIYRCSPINLALGVCDAIRQFAAELFSGELSRRAKKDAPPVAVQAKTGVLKMALFLVVIMVSFVTFAFAAIAAGKYLLPVLMDPNRSWSTSILNYVIIAIVGLFLVVRALRTTIRVSKAVHAKAKELCYRGYEVRYGLRKRFRLGM